jgi:PRTRC genetic system protein A
MGRHKIESGHNNFQQQQESFWEGKKHRSFGPLGKHEPDIDPKQKIALQKVMVGHYIEKIPDNNKKSVVYVMQGNGIFERRVNKLGEFVTKIADATIPGLEINLKEGWTLTVPRIPASFLGTAVSFFRKIYEKFSSEVFIQFFYDKTENTYNIHCPKQTVSMASVRYDNDEIFNDKDKILVLEMHSHGNMGAFFSGTDNGDEKADRFYGVIGKITDFFPELKLRLIIGGHPAEVNAEDIFDVDEEMYHMESYPKAWCANIKEEKIIHKSFPKDKDIMPLWNEEELKDYMDMFKDGSHLYSPNDIHDDKEVEIEYIDGNEKEDAPKPFNNFDWRNRRF